MNNPLYLYLHYLLQQHLQTFALMHKTTQTGQNYIFIPFDSPNVKIEHPKFGVLDVVDTHFSCFSEMTEESGFSDIHFTAVLASDLVELKFHVYQNQAGQVCGFNSKNLKANDESSPLKLSEVKEIFHEAIPFLREKRRAFSLFIETHEKAFSSETKLFRELLFLEEGELEPQIASLQKILKTLEVLNISNPSLYTKKQAHYATILAEKSELQAYQATYQPMHALPVIEARSLSPLEIVKQDVTCELISKTKENLHIFQQVLDESTERLIRAEGALNLEIHPLYRRKLLEVAELNDSLNEQLFQLEEMKLNASQKLTLQHFARQSTQLQCVSKDFMNKYLEAMVLCNQLEDFSVVYHFMEHPKPLILLHLLRHQSHEILIAILKKFNISIFEPLFQAAPVTIFEHMLHHENERCFSAILEQMHIDFSIELPDGRPAGVLILDLHPVNSIRIKCFSETPQFNSKMFFIRLRNRMQELLDANHPMGVQLSGILSTINIYTESNGPRIINSSRIMQKISDSNHSFFTGFTSQLEEKDFLKQERFLRLIQQYDELGKRRHEKAKASRQTVHQAQVHRGFLNDFCSDSIIERLEGLMPGLTEDQAYEAMHVAYQVADAYDRVMDIDTELKKVGGISLRTAKSLIAKKEQLLKKIQDLSEGPRVEQEAPVILSVANRHVMMFMTEEEQLQTRIFLTQKTQEKPIEFYAALEGITCVHLELMQSARTSLAEYCEKLEPKFIPVALDFLDRLMKELTLANPPEETLVHLTEFYMSVSQKIFK
ncbi:MAG TPA: hypothetical protein DCZ80_02975 [Legionellales bacterium]|nr:hypothetical protein [Legionellales bacterium]